MPSFVGRPTIELDEIDSTNQFALDLISKSTPTEGTVVLTFDQRQGKGQIGRNWESAPYENITLSVILKPNFLLAKDQFYLNAAVTLAVADFIAEQTTAEIQVKWPNDIYAGSQKVSGILIQNTLSGDRLHYSVAGIGINVNQSEFSKKAPLAVSLYGLTGYKFDLRNLLRPLFASVERRYIQLKNGRLSELMDAYTAQLYQKDALCKYQLADGAEVDGCIRGVNALGQLVVEIGGVRRQFNFRDITYLSHGSSSYHRR